MRVGWLANWQASDGWGRRLQLTSEIIVMFPSMSAAVGNDRVGSGRVVPAASLEHTIEEIFSPTDGFFPR